MGLPSEYGNIDSNNEKTSISSLANLIGRSEAVIFNINDIDDEVSIG